MKMALLLPTRLWPHEVSPGVVQLISLPSAFCSALRWWLIEACSSYLGKKLSEIYVETVDYALSLVRGSV